ncbi:hypothetical protein Avbf_01629 [Armadillidium vulgare]|nr:hypothetical protein Avbf_01629 [Armadillidium vulgare]
MTHMNTFYFSKHFFVSRFYSCRNMCLIEPRKTLAALINYLLESIFPKKFDMSQNGVNKYKPLNYACFPTSRLLV